MLKLPRKAIEKIESAPLTFRSWLISFTAIIAVRILVEEWIASGLKNSTLTTFFYGISHTFLFFLLSYLLVAFLLRYFLGVETKKIFSALLFGYFLVITPPIIDHVISGGGGFWSFYKFDSLRGLGERFLTFFGDRWDLGITYGVRFEVAAALVFIFIYSLIKTSEENFKFEILNFKMISKFLNFINSVLFQNSKFKIQNSSIFKKITSALYSLIITFVSYIIFFILGTFPSYLTIFTLGFSKGFLAVRDVDIAQMFLSPVKIFSREIAEIKSALSIKMVLIYSLMLFAVSVIYLYREYKNKLLAIIRNSRPPQLIYHLGLFFVGMGIFIAFQGTAPEITLFNLSALALLIISIAGSWIASVIINDIEDEKIDQKTNPNRPFIKKVFVLEEYRKIGQGIFLVSVIFAAFVSLKIALLLVAYQAIAFLYSSWPLRLKRFPFVSTFVSAIASLMILFSGFILVSPEQNIKNLPNNIIILLVIGFTLSLPVKDFKDIEGDGKEGVFTIPVFFGEQWGKLIVGGGIFLSYLLSVLLLNEFRLFWWAMLSGGASFWLVNSMGEGKKINPRNIFWWVMGVVIIYGIILVKTVFL